MKRRFIAGATCQECNSQDSLLLEINGENETLLCVDCDFKMTRSEIEQASQFGANKHSNEKLIASFDPKELYPKEL